MSSVATSEQDQYRNSVYRAVLQAVQHGIKGFTNVLSYCDGADPAIVKSVLAEIATASQSGSGATHSTVGREVIDILPDYPAPDPFRSQWWFSALGINRLLALVQESAGQFTNAKVLSVGTPTLAAALCQRNLPTTILDVDTDVLSSISKALQKITDCSVRQYDVQDQFPEDLRDQFQIAVLDPPWYQPTLYAFFNCALSAVTNEGEIFCTLPGRLTRPDIETFTQQLFTDLMQSGHDILRFERGTIEYQVPRFEFAALKRTMGEFEGIPWRSGDLIQIRKKSSQTLAVEKQVSIHQRAFSRNPAEFRIFTRNASSLTSGIAVVLENYSRNISSRAHVGEFPDVWSTEKVGVKTSDIDAVHDTLAAWASGLNKEKTIEALTSGERSSDDAANIGSELDEKFGIWKYFASQQPLRTEEQLASIRQAALSPWAVPPTDHEHGKESDRYRTTYQRDRDRVLWSAGLRRLSNKTQLFPTQHDDDLRQRLTHSIEVYQLAATIGTSFGLDGDLIEAGALAHDIGHTPFGHAGEYALNQLFNEIHRELGGFNHYEHGVDVVRFLEGPYYASSTTQFSGLNLSDEVLECIFKHTYCHAGDLGSEDLLKISKHQDRIRSGFCHLEGQAVRAADKISYLISDIEDGIRLSCLTHSDLLSCRLFHRPPLNFHPKRDQTLHEQFLEQRRILLKILMEDILKASSKRLELLSPKSYSSAAGATEYTIQHSDDILGDISEVWRKLQSGKLHKDGRVVSANLQAARVVAELTTVYSVIPDLIDNRFRLEYERLKMSKYLDAYRKRVGTGHKVEIRSELISFLPMHLLIGSAKEPGKPSHVPVEDLIMSKDYVAGLSDSRARQLHQDIFKS